MSHPVYSDFSHMIASQKSTDIGNLTFAVGLREEDAESMVAKILPLTKIIPCEKKERKIKVKKKEKVIVEEKVCVRSDCLARRDRLFELKSENETARVQLKGLEAKVAASKNKLALTEKSIQMTEDKNEVLRGKIEDAQARIFMIEADVERGDSHNILLKNQLAGLQLEIERLMAQTQEHVENLAVALDNNSSAHGVVFAKYRNSQDTKLAAEVLTLPFADDDSDDD